jgi:hypothetical protein
MTQAEGLVVFTGFCTVLERVPGGYRDQPPLRRSIG